MQTFAERPRGARRGERSVALETRLKRSSQIASDSLEPLARKLLPFSRALYFFLLFARNFGFVYLFCVCVGVCVLCRASWPIRDDYWRHSVCVVHACLSVVYLFFLLGFIWVSVFVRVRGKRRRIPRRRIAALLCERQNAVLL